MDKILIQCRPHRHGERGALYYFVGYDRDKDNLFEDWIFLDWGATQRATNQGIIKWGMRSNQRDGAMANFMWTEADRIPEYCILAKNWGIKKRNSGIVPEPSTQFDLPF